MLVKPCLRALYGNPVADGETLLVRESVAVNTCSHPRCRYYRKVDLVYICDAVGILVARTVVAVDGRCDSNVGEVV